ncbi:hypothetical protein DFH08DRAFT_960521 [Mycena albidolilacea]|uniref:Uncharacterized protein n=1 Tax=Mycena albidolilacea TaxID=1033008 RepID=A0AAD7ERX7_9AGAR|nr:hypothetical protein DFH08DRAFT_960521 [Mycena albidolilacea]
MQCVYLLSTFFSSGCLHCASYYNRSKGSVYVSATSPPQVPQFFHIIVFLDPPPFGIAHQRCFKFDASVKTHKDDKRPRSRYGQQRIFRLTQAIVKGTQCMANVILCARAALMRKAYLKFPGADFWDKLDKRLAKIRREAAGDAKKIIKAFRKLLDEDQEKYVKTDDPIDETAVDEFQQGVDDLIDIAAINTATLVQGGSV